MDYIREEFLRQRRALERLMTGGAKTVEAEGAEETAPAYGMYVKGERPDAVENRAVSAAEAGRAVVRRVAAGKSGALRRIGVPAAAAAGAAGLAAVESVSAVMRTEKTDARAVSRAIQRDARRYDGGFSLY